MAQRASADYVLREFVFSFIVLSNPDLKYELLKVLSCCTWFYDCLSDRRT